MGWSDLAREPVADGPFIKYLPLNSNDLFAGVVQF